MIHIVPQNLELKEKEEIKLNVAWIVVLISYRSFSNLDTLYLMIGTRVHYGIDASMFEWAAERCRKVQMYSETARFLSLLIIPLNKYIHAMFSKKNCQYTLF